MGLSGMLDVYTTTGSIDEEVFLGFLENYDNTRICNSDARPVLEPQIRCHRDE